jgi:hypothetical protein
MKHLDYFAGLNDFQDSKDFRNYSKVRVEPIVRCSKDHDRDTSASHRLLTLDALVRREKCREH